MLRFRMPGLRCVRGMPTKKLNACISWEVAWAAAHMDENEIASNRHSLSYPGAAKFGARPSGASDSRMSAPVTLRAHHHARRLK